LLVRSDTSSSERRVSPSWTITTLKARLEPITGIPASCQKLSLKIASQAPQAVEAADEETTQIGAWPLQAYAELQVGRGLSCCFIAITYHPLLSSSGNELVLASIPRLALHTGQPRSRSCHLSRDQIVHACVAVAYETSRGIVLGPLLVD
jgi:hypothetical protein